MSPRSGTAGTSPAEPAAPRADQPPAGAVASSAMPSHSSIKMEKSYICSSQPV